MKSRGELETERGAWKLQKGEFGSSEFPRGSIENWGVGNLRFIGLVGLS